MIISVMIILLLFSCANKGEAPYISNVVITDIFDVPINSASIGDTVYCYITAEDEDKDMTILNIKQYLNNTLMSNNDYALPATTVVKEIFYTIATIQGPTGNWRIDFQITDAEGNDSNIYSINFTVV